MGFNINEQRDGKLEGINITPDALAPKKEAKHLPIHTFIPEVQGIIGKWEEVFQVDVDFCTSAVYSAVASAVGDKFTIRDGKDYTNTLSLWLCQVAPSGYGKSPVEGAAMKPIVKRQKAMNDEYRRKLEEWKAKKEGEEPKVQRLFVTDSTPEALYKALQDNPSGLLLLRKELSGWIEDFGRYNKSGEINNLLSIWSGEEIYIDRITRVGNFVTDPCLNVFGGTQPGRLSKVWGRDVLLSSGFDARMLWVYPEVEIPTEYNEATIDDAYNQWWTGFIARLFDFERREVTLEKKAKEMYIHFWEHTQAKKKASDENMKSVYGKLEIYCLKWAGITFLLSEENYNADWALAQIDEQSMEVAVEAMGLFEQWALKTYNKMCEPTGGFYISKADLIKRVDEAYQIKNITQFAESLGVSRQLVSRALNKQ